jgi:hypothetical protein
MKNTLAENMLRFGVKNLSEDVKTKLAEQQTTAGGTENNLANIYTKLSYLKPYIDVNGFITGKKYTTGGDSFIRWYPKATIIRLGLGTEDTVLIMGNRGNTVDTKFNPSISVTKANDGFETFVAVKGTKSLKDLVENLLSYSSLNETNYKNLFINTNIFDYIKPSSKQELEALITKYPAKKSSIDNIINTLKLT